MRNYMQCGHDKNPADSCIAKLHAEYCPAYGMLPRDVQESIALEIHCNLMAESLGRDKAADASLVASIENAGCEQGATGRAKLLEKYMDSPAAMGAMQHFTKDYLSAEEACAAEDK